MADNLPKIELNTAKTVDVLEKNHNTLASIDRSMDKLFVSFNRFQETTKEQIRANNVKDTLNADPQSKKGLGVIGGAASAQAEGSTGRGGMGLLGGLGALGSGLGAAGLGVGVAAGGIGVALFGLAEVMENFDAQGVKDGVETLLSIGEGYESRTEFLKEGGALGLALAGIGSGLIVFSAGAGASSLAQFVTEDDWASKVKNNVETLLSINTASVIDTVGISLTMGALGRGLLAFSTGATVAGLSQFVTEDDWASKVKNNVESLLSINTESVIDTAGIAATMGALGAGLLAFSVGATTTGLSQFTTDDDWADRTKNSVESLLSIDTKSAIDTAGIALTMGAISAGLVAFSAGVTATGLSQFTTEDDWASRVKNSVETLLSIGTLGFWDTAALVATMTGIGGALAVFSAGKAAEGVSQGLQMFNGDQPFAERVKGEVETFLSIAQLDGIGADTKTFVSAMTGIGAGLAAFALGKGLEGGASATQGIIGFFGGENQGFADRIKTEVSTLLSITDGVSGDGATFKLAMGNISDGLMKFAGGQLGSSLANVGSSVLNFLTGDESPIEQVLTIADKADALTRGANALGSIANNLTKFQAVNFDGSNFNIKGFADDLKDAVPIIEAAIMGDDGGWFGTKILGLASPEIDYDGAKRNIEMLRGSLNVPVSSAVTATVEQSALSQGVASSSQAIIVNNNRTGDRINNSTSTSAPVIVTGGTDGIGMRPDSS